MQVDTFAYNYKRLMIPFSSVKTSLIFMMAYSKKSLLFISLISQSIIERDTFTALHNNI